MDDWVNKDLGEDAAEYLVLGCYTLDVGSAASLEGCDWLAIGINELDALFIGGLLADGGLYAHPFDNVDGATANIDTCTYEAQGWIPFDDGDIGIGIGTKQAVCEDAARDTGTGDEDFEVRHGLYQMLPWYDLTRYYNVFYICPPCCCQLRG